MDVSIKAFMGTPETVAVFEVGSCEVTEVAVDVGFNGGEGRIEIVAEVLEG